MTSQPHSFEPHTGATTADAMAAVAAPSADAAAVSEPTAWGDVGAHLRFWSVALGGVALDLWSKHTVFNWLRQNHEPYVLVPYVLSFHTMFNPGALFGIGAGQTEWFLVASVLALILVFWMFGQSSPRRFLLQIALGGILAGAMGNMYDRIFVKLVEQRPGGYVRYYEREDQSDRILLHEYPRSPDVNPRTLPTEIGPQLPPTLGYVRDFIKINSTFFGKEIWPWVFNVADMLLVGGVGILAIHMWRDRRPAAPA